MSADEMLSVTETLIPRNAMFRGRKVRIVTYQPKASRPFQIVDTDDSMRWVTRTELTFLRTRKA